MIIKLEKITNSFVVFTLLIILIGCNSVINRREPNNKLIGKEFGSDIIESEKTALEYAEMIFKSKELNTDFNTAKPFDISSVENDKVWYIIAKDKSNNVKKNSYHIKILKNNGKILDYWVNH